MISGHEAGDLTDDELAPHLERMMQLVDPAVGIVTHLYTQFRDLDDPKLFNATAMLTNNGRYAEGEGFGNAAQGNGGAGLTRTRAMIGAIGEALERYGCSIIDRKSQKFGSAIHLREIGLNAFPPEKIALYSKEQYDDPSFPFSKIDCRTHLSWSPCANLTSGGNTYFPSNLIYLPYVPANDEEVIFSPTISTGQATGPDYTSAAVTGLLETIERDAYVICWLSKMNFPVIDISSSQKVSCFIKERFGNCPLDIRLHSITCDVQIPIILATAIDRENPDISCIVGVAAGLDPEITAIRALIELAQDRFYAKYLARSKEPVCFQTNFEDIDDFEKRVIYFLNPEAADHFSFLRDSPLQTQFKDMPKFDPPSKLVALDHLVEQVGQTGATVLLADTTPDDLRSVGLSVVKAIVPEFQELEGDHNLRFLGCSRTYEMPVKLGRGQYLAPTDVNPVPHPLP